MNLQNHNTVHSLVINFLLFFIKYCSPHQKQKILRSTTKIIFQVPTNGTMPPYGLHEGFREFNGCYYSDCYYTKNANFFNDVQAKRHTLGFDAVIFPVPSFRHDHNACSAVPKIRHPHQRYIMALREAPWPNLSPPWINRNQFSRDFFNWTWTYRHDSDLVNPISYIVPKHDLKMRQYLKKAIGLRPNKMPSNFKLDQKEKLVYWVVSNCNTHSKREDYVGILQHYIPVDIYGKCGTFTCSHKSDCFDNLSEKYKFYLAFENAICPDYVTEKFFRTLRLPIVPIVMGGDNYKGLLPSGTYIDVNDFKSIKALANHLIYLDKNPSAYEAYFAARKDFEMYERWPLCSLCEKLHNPNEAWQTYKDVYEWWYLDDQGEYLCEDGIARHYFHSPNDLQARENHRKRKSISGKKTVYDILYYE